ncbi:putative sulfite reductase-associated electron transfer protein DsrO [Desulfonauticus submarinus]|uniref:Putative sulfite reductase-associated electron transfer protein DsrO n=1 Tax=Desulfonauticus submarinus TaxID=206665 RepID=A0A1H0CJW5_9BACT|nr:4Fe-4S dicluster domain-containing protein [Desulfonauticus submarinus]SDN58177.1 putative sulfite reductase-associated electron transfer protein DsrO [Desulfonauticus submarinus]
MKSNRRQFLRTIGLATLGWSLCPSLLRATEHGGAHGKGKRWAMAIDTKKLTEEVMEKCINACNKAHNIPHIPNKKEIKWIWIETFHHLFPGQMGDKVHLSEYPEKKSLALCNHCDNPPCVRVCPTKATFKREDGIVMMDFHRCIGCRYCMAACPYGSRSFNFYDPRKFLKEENINFPTRTKGVVEKCLFCYERLDEGKKPYCVEAAEGVIYFGDLNDPHSEVRKVLAERYAITRKPELGTLPCVYYLI